MVLYNSLNALKAKRLPKGSYADGQGLWLIKRTNHFGKWIVRLHIGGRRREMGLGRYPDVSLKEARERAADARYLVRDGRDPIAERKAAREKYHALSLADAVQSCFAARQAELKHGGKAGRWLSPLKTHVLPSLGKVPVSKIDQHRIKQVIDPIWHEKASTAKKALDRLGLVLKHAAALGEDVDLQAVLKAKALLGKQKHQVTHIASLPYQEAPAFYAWLRQRDNMAAYALRFLIMTVARNSEVRLAQFSEIEDDVWIIAAERTKTDKEHRVPLNKEAMLIVSLMRENSSSPYLFPSLRGRPLSDMAMSKFMRDNGYTARPHGFRATFRTWVEEQTDTPFEVKESALGHAVDQGVVGAYQRGDRLEKRRRLMEVWGRFIKNNPRIISPTFTSR